MLVHQSGDNCGTLEVRHGARIADLPTRSLKAKEHGHAQRAHAQPHQTSSVALGIDGRPPDLQFQSERIWSRPTSSRATAARINRVTEHEWQTSRLATTRRKNTVSTTRSCTITSQVKLVTRHEWRTTRPTNLSRTLHCVNHCIRHRIKCLIPTIVLPFDKTMH